MTPYILVLVASMTVGASTFGKNEKFYPKRDSAISVEELKQALSSETDPEQKFLLHGKLVRKYCSVKWSVNKENVAEIRKAAQSLLAEANLHQKHFAYASALHHSHLALGRADLFEGKTEAAKSHLLAAAQISNDPALTTFGPNMTLAKEMLEKCEKSSVLKYLNDCQRFWNHENAKSQISEWQARIESGHIPDFKANLHY